MQLIPLVLTLFLVLSLSVFSLQKKAHQTLLLRTRLLEHFSLENRLQQEVLRIFFAKEELVDPKTDATKKQGSFRNKRLITAATRNSRLGLNGLLQDQPNPKLYETALRLLTLLYKNDSAIDPRELLNEILSKAKECLKVDPKRQYLHFLELPNPSLMLIKALKGTQGYSFTYGKGIPKIEDFFALFIKGMQQEIVASHASYPLLIAAFGEPRAQWILKKEEETEKTLNLEGIEGLLLEKKLPLTPQERKLLTNQRFPPERTKGKQIVVMEPHLQLEARQTLCTYQIKGPSQQEKTGVEIRSIPDV